MSIDLTRAAAFMAGNARLLDRRRFELLTAAQASDDLRAAVLAALAGYRNSDGGFGWGLEPDLRARESQPGGALHAFEAFADAAPELTTDAVGLCDWLQGAALPDGGLPFAFPVADPAACAPFWAEADPTVSSLQITAAVAAQAHRVARFDARVANHPWLDTVTRYCLAEIGRLDTAPFAYVLSFALQFLDAAAGTVPEARDLLGHLARFVPPDGAVPVEGGAPGETLHLLDYAPEPGRPVRALFADDAVDADLARLAGGQQPDGGWEPGFDSYSDAARLEWRGYVTVRAVAILRAHDR